VKQPDGRRYSCGTVCPPPSFFFFDSVEWRRGRPAGRPMDAFARRVRATSSGTDEVSLRKAHQHASHSALPQVEKDVYAHPVLALFHDDMWRLTTNPPIPPLSELRRGVGISWGFKPKLRLVTVIAKPCRPGESPPGPPRWSTPARWTRIGGQRHRLRAARGRRQAASPNATLTAAHRQSGDRSSAGAPPGSRP